MRLRKRRIQCRIDAEKGEEIERLAGLRGMDLSSMSAYLMERGLEREAQQEQLHVARLIESHGEQIEQLQGQLEALEVRESERFLRLLGHLQILQAMTTEEVFCQRVKMLDDRPKDYARAVESARKQVSEDARLYRESVAAAGPVRRAKGT